MMFPRHSYSELQKRPANSVRSNMRVETRAGCNIQDERELEPALWFPGARQNEYDRMAIGSWKSQNWSTSTSRNLHGSAVFARSLQLPGRNVSDNVEHDINNERQLFRKRQSIENILNHQYSNSFDSQRRNSLQLASAGLKDEEIIELMRRNQTVMELEKLKIQLESHDGDDAICSEKLWQLMTKSLATPPMVTGPPITAAIAETSPKGKKPLLGLLTDCLDQGLLEQQLSRVMDSPDSGFVGNWDLESLSNLTTPSPQPSAVAMLQFPATAAMATIATTELDLRKSGKEIDLIQMEDDQPQEELQQETMVINYQGRNLLDLYDNMTYQWSFQMSPLPANFQCRPLYQRLGPNGLPEDINMQQCPHCDFQISIKN